MIKENKMKTEITIKLVIEHDSELAKQQGVEMFNENLKVGQSIRGHNGKGESYDLKVESISEKPIERHCPACGSTKWFHDGQWCECTECYTKFV